MLGFRLAIWDFLTFAVILGLVGAFLTVAVFVPWFAIEDRHNSQGGTGAIAGVSPKERTSVGPVPSADRTVMIERCPCLLWSFSK